MPKQIRLIRGEKGSPGRIEKLHTDEPDMLLTLLKDGDMGLGSDPARANRHRFIKGLGFSHEKVYSLRQVHSKKILVTGEEAQPEGDGLVSGKEDHILTVTVADCMPIYLFHRRARKHALLHSGWKGTGIAAEAVRILHDLYGLSPRELTAVLGPSIRSCCYRVDAPRADFFGQLWGSRSVIFRDSSGNGRVPFIDLLSANIGILQGLGLKDIRYVEECTACSADLGSFRREGPESFTRMLAMIGFFN